MRDPSKPLDVNAVVLDPAAHFASPMDVVKDKRLTRGDKHRILESWIHDAGLLSQAEAENRHGRERTRLQEAKVALQELQLSVLRTVSVASGRDWLSSGSCTSIADALRHPYRRLLSCVPQVSSARLSARAFDPGRFCDSSEAQRAATLAGSRRPPRVVRFRPEAAILVAQERTLGAQRADIAFEAF